ncbi:hypothetical protein KBP30_06045 [Streptomyces sp. Go40/10]|uniref:DUF6895 family protein n=1 Tax=Streptomyces sp. Go40/10 TaxID=2825844 RepID=UPI001E606ECA|nr:hypothetical protein [Streptomyces sp. Go40/10]UFR00762.1 hypothetical protein KBP30_06045 [Streptomyces sp. Go40/10]
MLNESANAALSWIESHLSHFGVARHATDEFDRFLLLKPLSELALVASLLARDPGCAERCSPLADWIWEEIGSGDDLVRLTCARPELLEVVSLYASLYTMGYRSNRLDAWVSYLSNSALMQGMELPAWRHTALRYNLARLELSPPPVKPAAGSWLSAMPEPWTFSDATGYPMTHEVFYLTDFGRRPEALTTPGVSAYLAFWLPTWLKCAQEAGNQDLAAELLMVGTCMAEPVGSPGLSELRAWQRTDGSFPGPSGAGSGLPCRDGDTARRRFLSTYHTTLVALLALTADSWAPCRCPGGLTSVSSDGGQAV